MPKWPMKIAPGCDLTPLKAKVLRHVADAGEAGLCAGPLTPGGTLGALSQFGLVERAPTPAKHVLGGRRYRVTAEGRVVIQKLGARG